MKDKINHLRSCNIAIKDLKQICKFKKIKKYSTLSKKELINLLDRYFAAVKLQRFIRSKLAQENMCLITMENIKYPCFPFKPKGSNKFTYYNLKPIVEYFQSTGDFRDPKTREEINDKHLILLDRLRKEHNVKGSTQKSLMYLSKNYKYYKKRKEYEENIIVLERCLDDIVSSMRSILEDKNRSSGIKFTLNTLFFNSFSIYFKKLVDTSKSRAKTFIDRTILVINETVDRPTTNFKNFTKDQMSNTFLLRDNIVSFLHQTKFDYLNEF
jgi:hypothetical protein